MHLVLPGRLGKCVWNHRGINPIRPYLVLRGMQQECSHNPNEISSFNAELVLREVPGKLAQRGRQTQRFRRLGQRAAGLHAPGDEVIRVACPPGGLGLGAALDLARR